MYVSDLLYTSDVQQNIVMLVEETGHDSRQTSLLHSRF